ncbi:MAG: AMP-binding protein, partial [Acidimicrobiales bacterium]
MAGSGEVMTYAQLDAEANRVSHVLRNAGFEPGDHIALCMENHPRYLAVLWGCHYAGLIYTAMSSRLTTEEMAYIIENCEAKGFITSTYKADQAGELRDLMPGVDLRLMLDGTIDGYDAYEAAV